MARQSKEEETYDCIMSGGNTYNEEFHCRLVLSVMSNCGSVPKFCAAAKVSDTTFYNWSNAHPKFNQCYRIGKMMAQADWEDEGSLNSSNEDFNFKHWETVGKMHHGFNEQAKIRLKIDKDANPYEQYGQILDQASSGEFNATQLKLIMESINIGVRAHESFKLQSELEDMQKDIESMRDNTDG